MNTIYQDGREYDNLGMGQGARDEIEFYFAQAGRGTSTLELACGTGRLTVPLAERGIDITGIDNAPAMLSAAEAKAAGGGVSPAFIEADMRGFSLGKTFDLIFLPNNSLGHLHGLADIRSCFSCVRRHLSSGGRFIVDMFGPSLPLLMREAGRHYPVAEYVHPDGTPVAIMETVWYDAATQISHSLWHYQREGEPADIRAFDMRMFFPQELDALLTLSGFTIEAKYGGFDKSAFSAASRQQLVVCR